MEYADVALTTFRLFQRVAKVLEPPPQLTVSEWADRYRVLSKGLSAESVSGIRTECLTNGRSWMRSAI